MERSGRGDGPHPAGWCKGLQPCVAEAPDLGIEGVSRKPALRHLVEARDVALMDVLIADRQQAAASNAEQCFCIAGDLVIPGGGLQAEIAAGHEVAETPEGDAADYRSPRRSPLDIQPGAITLTTEEIADCAE